MANKPVPVRVRQVYVFENGVRAKVLDVAGRGKNASAFVSNMGNGYAGWITYRALRRGKLEEPEEKPSEDEPDPR